MKHMFRLLGRWAALGYGIGMIVLVAMFFFNYGGRYMRVLAEWLPIHY